ncbi:N-succinylarginine dihydrolase [Desulfomonile tiedjei]|uniref:N-succinylarginine dihydrolase n=1 Tax=Desulfomonile tiedjei (strain ATCC 49306 / DSM 6799 / DCB-1) TaxID=706587 RepID=I4C7C7_DESTA|nr:N-succinylarginine dihydrolase [Desulfomonile tiedjei]AFM25468.1 succinylarginine dihydrolase [Desulfomonile tiedjei DSM 6799]
MTREMNFDGLVGPTHNYAGLSYGNPASMEHALTVSDPRSAVLQGLEKMKLLADLGVPQAVIPPQDRPDIPMLRKLGFKGNDSDTISAVARDSKALLAAVYSSSSMWAANAATVSPSADTEDGKVHFTPANLITQFHRSLEPRFTARVLRKIFPDETQFVHHPPLPCALHYCDEGAANHVRLCSSVGEKGLELFVFGKRPFDTGDIGPLLFPARQSFEASRAIARLHGLDRNATIFLKQSSLAVDSGVFHNDVISVGNQNLFFFHELAFEQQLKSIAAVRDTFVKMYDAEPIFIEVANRRVPLELAVKTYLFNIQIVTLANNDMTVIAPTEIAETPQTADVIDNIIEDSNNPIKSVHYVNIRESMKNGGGPACLRLRVVLSETERQAVHPNVVLTSTLYHDLVRWAGAHYRDRLEPEDLADPQLIQETRTALDALTQILGLGSLYDFQRTGGERGS